MDQVMDIVKLNIFNLLRNKLRTVRTYSVNLE